MCHKPPLRSGTSACITRPISCIHPAPRLAGRDDSRLSRSRRTLDKRPCWTGARRHSSRSHQNDPVRTAGKYPRAIRSVWAACHCHRDARLSPTLKMIRLRPRPCRWARPEDEVFWVSFKRLAARGGPSCAVAAATYAGGRIFRGFGPRMDDPHHCWLVAKMPGEVKFSVMAQIYKLAG